MSAFIMGVVGWTFGPGRRWGLLVGAVVGVLAVVIAAASMLHAVVPGEKAAVPIRNPIPMDEEFANINRVSHWPAEWIDAVCERPVYTLRNYTMLPHATANSSCRSLIKPGGDVDYLMISRFPSELPMQVDLHNAGYQWYAFAFDHGSLIAFETVSDSEVVGSNGLRESPVLQPLKRFGFHIYANPGPP
ncbi:hypothetical protein [Mycolicibacterium madagascariense]|uniref:hypothetical protein n=1 Tax=Mycolicibacterium madagascariense TaxID=212765 RepID=UPI0013CF7C01|nr:hypothetical protein [Mycolicibacterium madagascariense]MCV7015656.1 hypothetical protein [Mycolicibacterium madagascariense]